MFRWKTQIDEVRHLFCISCLDEFSRLPRSNDASSIPGQLTAPCPSCRKPVALLIVRVDPTRTADQEASDKDAWKPSHLSRMLLKCWKSNGQLDPHLWEALYLAIDLHPVLTRCGYIYSHFQPVSCASQTRDRDARFAAPLMRGRFFELPSKIRALCRTFLRMKCCVCIVETDSQASSGIIGN
jgi:hypothetical protein